MVLKQKSAKPEGGEKTQLIAGNDVETEYKCFVLTNLHNFTVWTQLSNSVTDFVYLNFGLVAFSRVKVPSCVIRQLFRNKLLNSEVKATTKYTFPELSCNTAGASPITSRLSNYFCYRI